MVEMYEEIVADARRFVDKCAMNKATELTINGRDKFSDGPNCLANCVVPENIHTPTTEGIGNSEGVGGQRPRKFRRGEGVERSIWFPDALRFNTDSKILSYMYLLSRSFT